MRIIDWSADVCSSDLACTRGREPPSPEHRDGEPRMGLTAGGDPRPTEKRPRGVDDRPWSLAAAVIHRLLDKGTCGTARHLSFRDDDPTPGRSRLERFRRF